MTEWSLWTVQVLPQSAETEFIHSGPAEAALLLLLLFYFLFYLKSFHMGNIRLILPLSR